MKTNPSLAETPYASIRPARVPSLATGYCSLTTDHWLLTLALLLGLCLPWTLHAQRAATATATVINGFVTGITVTDGGSGYTSAPGVSINGGGGSGATALALLNNDEVSQIIVLTAGSGYSSVPDVVIAPPDLPTQSILDLRMIPELTIYGEIGSTNQIQSANAFGNTNVWVVVTNVVLTSSPYTFYDTISTPGVQRYYRALVQGGTRPTAAAGYVWLPPGRFTMGSPASEVDRGSNEGPQTVVILAHGFYMGQHEVTQGEYQAVMGSNISYFTGDLNRPAESVNWFDARDYCANLTQQERTAGRLPAGWVYRLPTEAEWEYAARAGTTTRFSFGDDAGYTKLGEYAWYSSNSGSATHAVQTKKPNSWGLYDMAGNVWEWCSDWNGSYPGGSVIDPVGPASGSYRVGRGGSWYSDGRHCRSAIRASQTPDFRYNIVGFRAVLAPGQP